MINRKMRLKLLIVAKKNKFFVFITKQLILQG